MFSDVIKTPCGVIVVKALFSATGDNSATKVGVLQASSVAATLMNGATTVSDGYSTVSDSKKREAVSFESGAGARWRTCLRMALI